MADIGKQNAIQEMIVETLNNEMKALNGGKPVELSPEVFNYLSKNGDTAGSINWYNAL